MGENEFEERRQGGKKGGVGDLRSLSPIWSGQVWYHRSKNWVISDFKLRMSRSVWKIPQQVCVTLCRTRRRRRRTCPRLPTRGSCPRRSCRIYRGPWR